MRSSSTHSFCHDLRTIAQSALDSLTLIPEPFVQYRGKPVHRQLLGRHDRAGRLPYSTGFTLLELLVALSIFSIVA
ncbi:MAG: prepilin-type N-terminal cleavage/methylation domain-containing protein, partial [Gammaproteobacteria bacterium]|nr:prepilin-type N-terminal cleavage/methylation domain-containing protein [Gammaproteobacteria bacterium]